MLFCYGGGLYTIVELLFRGHSHPSMFVLGGLCFVLIGGINKVYPDMSLLLQMGISAIIITVLEFICGCIVNLWLLMDVWNYEEMPFNIDEPIQEDYIMGKPSRAKDKQIEIKEIIKN